MSTNILEAKNIVKKYAEHVALDDVSLSIKRNTIFGMLGPNGAGKTSFIRIINQITAPDSGIITFDGAPLNKKHITQIGYLPEERGLYKKMKVGEQAIYLSQLKGLTRHEAIKRLKIWFQKFEVEGWWNKRVEELSKGMQQKIQFIVTVIHEPQFLIFDEPFSGFDPINVDLLKDEILLLKENGATIIFSTHNMSSVEEICDEIALLNKSKIILEGEVNEVKNRFKSNIYNLEIETPAFDIKTIIPEDFSFVTSEEDHNISRLHIRIPKERSSNELLKIFLDHTTIHKFNEILPTMNEVFISSIKSKNNANLEM
ncbi:MAG: ATP-binding cassette domain-containing protein [Bacteroidota bacterium]